ncbi:MAG: DUF6265 family protein, partial [Bacteroidota bacterium]
MKVIYPILIFLCCWSIQMSFAQNDLLNTISLQEEFSSPKASITEVSWIAGHWQGEAFDGIIEEVWTPPLGNSMMAAFKLVNEEQITFYEIITIAEENESLVMKLKHFHSDLKGWEEKDEYIEAKLVKIEGQKAYFNGFTYERVDDEHLNIYVVMSNGEQKSEM